MTKEDIAYIEQALDITLPQELVEKYLSDFLNGIEEFPNLSKMFFVDPLLLVKMNLRMRRSGLQKKSFPKNYLIIGYTPKVEHFLINLFDESVIVYLVKKNKCFSYDPDDISKNTLMELHGFLKYYPISFLRRAKRKKEREESGIPPRQYTADDTYEILRRIRYGESIDEFFDDPKI